MSVLTQHPTDGRKMAQAASDDVFRNHLGAKLTERVEAGNYKVPLLPQIASQVMGLVADPEVDAGKISTLIHRDPALAGQVLRISNSAHYAPRMPIVSLQQAVARLGLNTIAEIALAASLQSGTFRVPGHEQELRRLWQHALASGAWSKEIARLRRTNVESAFLCGLLHGVGKPALLQIAVDTAVAASGRVDDAWLPALYEQSHAKVGRRIAEAWQLPGAVAAAIAFSSSYKDASSFRHDAMTTCLAARLSDWIAGRGGVDDETVRDHGVFEDLNLYPQDVDSLLGKKAAVTATVEALMV